MAETKTKKSSRRGGKAANAPAPCGPGSTCGHSGCEGTCRVRYVGPTSHTRDHHVQEAAQGARHVWTAAIVAGLAVVLTGTIAFSAADAATERVKLTEHQQILRRLENVERMVKDLHKKFIGQDTGANPPGQKDQACVKTCQGNMTACKTTAGEDATSRQACADTYESCVRACKTSTATTTVQ
ncbi:MAG TPA: hypothetical protein VN397_03315 [Candidatus Methylomirabilis sp.]|nr:hypothetical protein [Candidatus Methylomirabilis sp.]